MSAITLPPESNSAHFYSITLVASAPGDHADHVLEVQLTTLAGSVVASAPEHPFVYGYRLDPSGEGGYTLTTEFNADVSQFPSLGTFLIRVLLDGRQIAKAPLMLRR
jgi:hypothetical protein